MENKEEPPKGESNALFTTDKAAAILPQNIQQVQQQLQDTSIDINDEGGAIAPQNQAAEIVARDEQEEIDIDKLEPVIQSLIAGQRAGTYSRT